MSGDGYVLAITTDNRFKSMLIYLLDGQKQWELLRLTMVSGIQ